MEQDRRVTILLQAVEALYALVVLAWCALPFFDRILGSFSLLELPVTLAGLPPREPATFLVLAVLAGIVPLAALWKLALAPPRAAHPRRLRPDPHRSRARSDSSCPQP